MPARKCDTCCHVCREKSQIRKLTPQSKYTQANASAHTHTQARHSQEMMANHFVGCNRTNFASEPLLMSRSLMCKSSGPSAKLIQSPHNPAQVQPRSLLHYLSCVPNTVRPPTANKPVSWREKHTHTAHATLYLLYTENKKHTEAWKPAWWHAVMHLLHLHTVYSTPVSIFTPLCKSNTNDQIVLFCFFCYGVKVSLWFISFLHCFSTE